MRVLDKKCEVLTSHDLEGNMKPHAIMIEDEEGTQKEIKICKRLLPRKEKANKIEILVYSCQATINGVIRYLELKYNKETCKWVLWRM
ncbi:hypothetical protein [Clostridium sp. YIM B02551]|uniref:hypothetical protein n=1 Tax=Clostridium sp. YIM B02551 TaxID=2910679 RepID=UPI001EEC98B5|nr:hypothetical protein [Clostridium sp. YIM B02551]